MRTIKSIVVYYLSCPTAKEQDGVDYLGNIHLRNGYIPISDCRCYYHYVIRKDGVIDKGTPLTFETPHGVHRNNPDSISIAIMNTEPNKEQSESLSILTNLLKDTISGIKILHMYYKKGRV